MRIPPKHPPAPFEGLTADTSVSPADRQPLLTALQAAKHTPAQCESLWPSVRDYLDNYPDDAECTAAWIAAYEASLDRTLKQCAVQESSYQARDYRICAIVSTYASQDFIAECLDDLVGQTLAKDIEILVVDAASPQDERHIVQRFQKDHSNIRYMKTPFRIGIYAAWNLAARAARAPLLTPASTNDRLGPDAYAVLADALDRNCDVMLAYGDSYLTDQPHQRFGRHSPSARFGGVWQWPDYSFKDLLTTCRAGPHPMWRRVVHQHVGYFDPLYRALGDQALWLRIGRRWPLLHIGQFTGLVWLTPSSLSGDTASSQKELAELRLRHQNMHLAKCHAAALGRRLPAQRVRDALEGPVDYGYPRSFPLTPSGFVETVTRLVESGRLDDGLRYNGLYRCLFPRDGELKAFDALMKRLRTRS